LNLKSVQIKLLICSLLLIWPQPTWASNLLSAAQKGDLPAIIALYETGSALDQQDGNGNTALMLALRNKHPELAKWLITHKANPNLKRTGQDQMQNWRALNFAIAQGYLELSLALLATGAEVNYQARDVGTPLHQAASSGQLALVQALLKAKAAINARSNLANYVQRDWTPLMSAIDKENLEICLYLLQQGADPYLISGATSDSIERGQEDAIVQASYRLSREFVLKILQTQTQFIAQNKLKPESERVTKTLYYALFYQDLGLIKTLLKQGASLNGPSPALLVVTEPDVKLSYIQQLIAWGANPKIADTQGKTPLHAAIAAKRQDLVAYYLKQKVPLNTHDKNMFEQTPLHLAACGPSPILKLLLKYRPALELKDNSDKTPLFLAIDCNQLENVKLLLKAGARLSLKDSNAQTPVALALERGYFAMVMLLLQAGSKPLNQVERQTWLKQAQENLKNAGSESEKKAWQVILTKLD
jgi:ankyrin